jgi:hypothetical protein
MSGGRGGAGSGKLRILVTAMVMLGMIWTAASVLGYPWLTQPFEYLWSMMVLPFSAPR